MKCTKEGGPEQLNRVAGGCVCARASEGDQVGSYLCLGERSGALQPRETPTREAKSDAMRPGGLRVESRVIGRAAATDTLRRVSERRTRASAPGGAQVGSWIWLSERVGRVATAPVRVIGRTAATDAHAQARGLDTM